MTSLFVLSATLILILSLILFLIKISTASGNYTINKGSHYPKNILFRMPTYNVRYLKAFFMVHPNFYYGEMESIGDANLKYQISKIGGISFGGIHNNSMRLGCSLEPGKQGLYTLYAYLYIKGVRTTEVLMHEAVMGKEYCVEIRFDDSFCKAIIDVMDDHKTVASTYFYFNTRLGKLGYISAPYYGGSLPAPKNTDFKFQVSETSTKLKLKKI
jgi:hypothetical protein